MGLQGKSHTVEVTRASVWAAICTGVSPPVLSNFLVLGLPGGVMMAADACSFDVTTVMASILGNHPATLPPPPSPPTGTCSAGPCHLSPCTSSAQIVSSDDTVSSQPVAQTEAPAVCMYLANWLWPDNKEHCRM